MKQVFTDLLQALVRIMNLPRYYGTIHFVPAPGYEAYGEPAKQVESSIVERLEQNGEPQVCSYQGPSAELQGSDWRSIDGPFVAVCLNNVPWATESVMAAPEAKVIGSSSMFFFKSFLLAVDLICLTSVRCMMWLSMQFSDGYMDAIIIRDCPKADLLALMLKMSDGSYVKSTYVTYLKVNYGFNLYGFRSCATFSPNTSSICHQFNFAGEIFSVITRTACGESQEG
jgi:sphingosine kinase